MTEHWTFSPMTINGWCIHGVPYGPNWRCSQCSSGIPATSYGSPPPPNRPTAVGLAGNDPLDDIFATLDALPGPELRAFLKKLRARYKLDEIQPPLFPSVDLPSE